MKISILFYLDKRDIEDIVGYRHSFDDFQADLVAYYVDGSMQCRFENLTNPTYRRLDKVNRIQSPIILDSELAFILTGNVENISELKEECFEDDVFNIDNIWDIISDSLPDFRLSNASVEKLRAFWEEIAPTNEEHPVAPEDSSSESETIHQVESNNNTEGTTNGAVSTIDTITVGEFLNKFANIDRNLPIYVKCYQEGNIMEGQSPNIEVLSEVLVDAEDESKIYPVGSILICTTLNVD